MTKTMRLATVAALGVLMTFSLGTGATIVDFSVDAAGNAVLAGQIIDDEYAAWGVNISVANASSNGPNLGVAFNSASPTGGDPDLGTPATSGLGNASSEALGNLLIIQENGGESQVNPGFINTAPDDEWLGGQITFDFDSGISDFGFHVVDIEGTSESGFYAEFWDGATLVDTMTYTELVTNNGNPYYDSTLVFGNNSVNEIQPFSVLSNPSHTSFDRVVVNFAGSGGIDNIVFNSVVPEPSTFLLLGAGLAGLAARARKRRRS